MFLTREDPPEVNPKQVIQSNDTIKLPLTLKLLRRLPLPHQLGLLERIYGKRLAAEGLGWVECSNGIVWKLDLSDLMHRWVVYGDYEGSVGLNWIRRWLSEGGVVVDSGANIGQMLLYMAPLKDVSVFAFEPMEMAHNWVSECVSKQQDWNVRLERVGLSDHEYMTTLRIDGPRSTIRQDWYKSQPLEEQTIRLERLDELMIRLHVKSIRLWKLDVEGHELEALSGAQELLGRKAIEAIFVEVTGGQFSQVQEFLGRFNYRLFGLDKRSKLQPLTALPDGTTNLIALPQ